MGKARAQALSRADQGWLDVLGMSRKEKSTAIGVWCPGLVREKAEESENTLVKTSNECFSFLCL